MTRFLVIVTLLTLAQSAQSQELVDNGINDRIEAINAILRFRTDLSGDSTVIAECRLIKALDDSTAIDDLDPQFKPLLIAPDTGSTVPPPLRCAVRAFAKEDRRVLWLQDLIEVHREGSSFLPPAQRKRFEVTFQVLMGPGYREYHRYMVEPHGVEGVRQDGEMKTRLGPWRVTEFRLVGWDWHWGDSAGHGSSVRRP